MILIVKNKLTNEIEELDVNSFNNNNTAIIQSGKGQTIISFNSDFEINVKEVADE